MKPEEFKRQIDEMCKNAPKFIQSPGPYIAGMVAVSEFKRNFQRECFDGKKWKEVQRRIPGHPSNTSATKHHPVRTTRLILTGDTGDLGRSIEIKRAGGGSATVWTAPSAFTGKEPYGAVHNEGLKSGRGAGFILPKRQFMGQTDSLDKQVLKELEKQLQDDGCGIIIVYSSNRETYSDGRQVFSPICIPKDAIRHINLAPGCVMNEFSNGVIPITK